MSRLSRYIATASLLGISAIHRADAESLTGIFSGQGRPCWGQLTLTSKTIEWTTSFSTCKATAYDIVDQDLKSQSPTASYRLKHRNPACKFPYISVKFDPEYPDYWQLVGYASEQAFEQRRETGSERQDHRLECSARKLK